MVSNYPKGIKVLSKDYPEMFERILGYEEYLPKIVAANGDAEKLRKVFWKDLADDYHWEFIEGEIVLRSGMTWYGSGVAQNLKSAVWNFTIGKKVGLVLGTRCVCSFPENDFSPYIMYYNPDVAATFHNQQNRFPIPVWIIEVNDENTEANNRGVKFSDYEKNGVKEYWMVNLNDKSIEKYILDKHGFDFQGKFSDGKICSNTLKGFEIALSEVFEK